jgi:hypothetical protein
MATNIELRRSNGSNYNEVIHFATNINIVQGLLGDDQKIKSNLLPTWLIGGMKYVGTINGTKAFTTLYDNIQTWLINNNIATNIGNFEGKYFVVGAGGATVPPDTTNVYVTSDDGVGDTQYTLEQGDWLIYDHYDSTINKHYWSVINNTYRDARENEAGVIQLASSAEAKAGTNATKAMTPARVKDYIDERLGNVNNTSDMNKPISNAVQAALNNKQDKHDALTNLTTINGSGFIKRNSDGTYLVDATTYVTPVGAQQAAMNELNGFIENDYIPNMASKAPLASPALTGTPTAPTPTTSDNSTKIATTAFVKAQNYITSAGAPVQSVAGKIGAVTLVKGDVGLGNVQNYGIATEAEAKAGTSDVKYMTPLKVKNAIDMFATIEKVTALPTDMSNHPAGKLIMLEI